MAEKIVFASGKGGVGKSTVTAGLCRAFESLGKSVLVIDADIGLRSLDLIFGVPGDIVFDWGDLLEKRCKFRQAAVAVGSSYLLAAPLRVPDGIKPDKLRRMVSALDDKFDYILIDAPAGIGEGLEYAAAMADRAVLVSLPDSVCVRSCDAASRSLEEMGISDQRLVINKLDAKAVKGRKLLRPDDVVDGCCVRLIGTVPEDKELNFRYTVGKDLKKRSPTKKAFVRIAKRLMGEQVKLYID